MRLAPGKVPTTNTTILRMAVLAFFRLLQRKTNLKREMPFEQTNLECYSYS
jgi:hypothetical protein